MSCFFFSSNDIYFIPVVVLTKQLNVTFPTICMVCQPRRQCLILVILTVWEDAINISIEIKLLPEERQYNCFRFYSAILGDFG